MSNTVHTEYNGRKVRIPESRGGYFSPAAGKIGDVKWAGWDDWYLVYVDGLYYVRAQAYEIEPCLIPEEEKDNG